MAIFFQGTCPRCGYKTIPKKGKGLVHDDDPGIAADDGMFSSLYVCSCNHCHELFQRNYVNGKSINKCVFCGSEDIIVHLPERVGMGNLKAAPCPVCLANWLEEQMKEIKLLKQKEEEDWNSGIYTDGFTKADELELELKLYFGWYSETLEKIDPVFRIGEKFPLDWEFVGSCF